jgi:DNA replication protein DnaC
MSEQLERTIAAAGVPPRFADRRLDTFDPTRSPAGAAALDWARSNVMEPHSGLLAGMVGTGKTHLAAGILTARAETWLARYPEPDGENQNGTWWVRPELADLFVDVPGMLDEVRRWIGRSDGTDPMARYRTTRGLLILDDLGREKVTDWASERLYVLVNDRYGALLPTIATSNLRPSELAKAGYEPIVRRLLDDRPAIWLEHRKAAGA